MEGFFYPMDELIDILDANGNLTYRTAMKSKAHKNGWYHQTVHVWFYTLDGKILLQQRSKNKDVFPLLWDVSVAGHIGAGENIKISAVREIEEEIGLSIQPVALQKIGIYKSEHKHSDTLIDCEYHHTFIAELKIPLHALQKQESEVESLKLISIDQFKNEVTEVLKYNYVPHETAYYNTICTEIMKRLHQ